MPWVSLRELHQQTGLAIRSLQYIREQEPGVLITREKSGRTEYKQPDCATNLRRREAEKAKKEKAGSAQPNFFEARARALVAEAKLKELELKRQLGEVLSHEILEETIRAIGDRLRSVLVNLPATYGLRLEALGVDVRDAEHVLEAIAVELTTALRGEADELDAEAIEFDRANEPSPPPPDGAAAGSGTLDPAEPRPAPGGAGASDDGPVAAEADADGMGGPVPDPLPGGVRATRPLAHRPGPVSGRHHGRRLWPAV